MLRKITAVFTFAVLFLSCGKDKAPPAPAVPAWTEKTSMPPDKGKGHHTSFVINGKAYIMGGIDGVDSKELRDLWEYDPQTDKWAEKASLPPGKERHSAVGFTIGGKGYLVAGRQGFKSLGDAWEYDPQTDKWTEKASLPAGQERDQAVGLALNGKGYIITGYNWVSDQILGDVWEYNPAGNGSWTKKKSLPAGKERRGTVGFILFDKLYIVAGYLNGTLRDCWQYDPKVDNWTERASLPLGKDRVSSAGFAVGNKGYLIGGVVNFTTELRDIWQYDSFTNKWVERESLPDSKKRYGSSGFSLNGKGYIVGGIEGNNILNDILEYDPAKDQ